MNLSDQNVIAPKPISSTSASQKLWREACEATRQMLWNLFLISSGSIICAIAVNGILVPNEFLSGGFVGMALIIHYLFPSIPVAWLYLLLNIPVFVLGWKYIGRRFFLYSLTGMAIFSAAVAWIHVSLPIHDRILASIFAGIISGAGGGIILRSLGSAGGMDILSIILLKRLAIRLGTSVLALNGLILAFAAYFFSLEGALYTLIFLFVSTQVLNIMVYGLSQRKAVYIISTQWESIHREIIENIHRGVTIIRGRGGYTGQNVQMVFTVISQQELPRLKKIVQHLDNDAFVVVTDTLEVMGRGIGNQPHW